MIQDDDLPLQRPDDASNEESGIRLTFAEARVLGCLWEKEATTPDYYPMTLNSLQTACNQKSNRDPVSEFDEATVERAVEGLREKHLAAKVHLAGSRSPKYKHTAERVFNLEPAQRAILTVLLLRGTQTSGELNQRSERMHKFSSTSAVEHVLGTLIDGPSGPLVRRFPPGAGRRVETFAHLLSGEPSSLVAGGGVAGSAEQIVLEDEASWRRKLEEEVAELKSELHELRASFDDLRRQLLG
jgi:uncharacterized protein YceH (UPF0502 family)